MSPPPLPVPAGDDDPVDLTRALPLFVYGTLLDERFVGHLLEHPVASEPAELRGFRIAELPAFQWPVLVAVDGAVASGSLYRDLSLEDLRRLDLYEGVAEGLYIRLEVEVETGRGGREAAWAYLPSDRTLVRGAG